MTEALLDQPPRDTPARVDTLLAEAWACRHENVPRCEALLQQALRAAQTIDYRHGQAYAILRLALCGYMRRQDAQLVDGSLQLALSMMRALGDKAGEAEALNLWGNVLCTSADHEQAIAIHQQALGLRRQIGDRVGEAGSLNNIARSLRMLSMTTESLDYQMQSLAVSQAIDAVLSQAYAQVGIGATLDELGDPAAALEPLDKALALVRRTQDRALECTALTDRGTALVKLGRRDEALDSLDQAMALALQTGNQGDLIRVQQALGQACMHFGDTGPATAHLHQALRAARDGGDLELEADLLLRLAQTRLKAGDATAAQSLGSEALILAEQRRDATVLGEAHQLLSQVHEALGQPAAALQHLRTHLALQQQRAQHLALRRAHAAMAKHEVDSARRELADARDTNHRQADQLAEVTAQSRELEQLAREDGLTGVANRRALDTELTRELERSRRFDHPLSVAMIDIDNFKAINDRCGHSTGDTVLRQVAALLRASCRANDLVARYGGEEFAVLMVQTEPDSACLLADKLRQRIQDHAWQAAHPALHTVTVSVGVAGFSGATDLAPQGLLAAADTALYQAKQQGKNRVQLGG